MTIRGKRVDLCVFDDLRPITMLSTTAHVFYYRWPRIKEGLVHEEQPALFPDTVKAPKNAYIYFDDRWFLRGSQTYDPQHRGYFGVGDRATTSFELKEHQVPKDIRLLKLLLT